MGLFISNSLRGRILLACPDWVAVPVRRLLYGPCSYPAMQTARFDLYRQRVARSGQIPRTVYSAWYRDQSPGKEGSYAFKPVCTVTLYEHFHLFDDKPYVEWLEVDSGYRRMGIATEVMLRLIEHYGPIEYSGATDEGEAFCEHLDSVTT